MNPVLRPLLALAVTLAAASARAHEGHEHGAEAQQEAPVAGLAAQPVAAPEAGAPRLAISQPPVELVAVQGSDGLLIYADDYASNAPLAGLRVQVQLGSRLLDASELAPGSYRIARDLIGDTGGTVKISLHGAGHDAELVGELPAAPIAFAKASTSPSPASTLPRFDHWTMLFGLALAVLSLAGGWSVKRRR